MEDPTRGTRMVDLGTHQLRARVSGAGERTFALVHGLADTLEIWDDLAPLLEPLGRVIRFDQRAHGDSSAPAGPSSRDDLAADLLALLDRLGAPRAVLVGHSLGGVAAICAALAAPERVAGLVLIGTASQCNQGTARWYRDIVRAGEVNALEGLAKAIYGPMSTRRVRGDAPGLVEVVRSLVSLHEEPLTPRLGEIACPTLVLVGGADPMGTAPSVIVQRGIPGARLEVLDGKGHWLQNEAPAEVATAIESWSKAIA